MRYLYIVGAAVLWASIGPVARYSLEGGIDPLELAFWRALVAGGLFAVHAAVVGRLRLARRDAPAVLVFALVGVSLFYAAYFEAVRLGGAALAAVLLYTAPVWVLIASALWLKERLTTRKALAVGIIVFGVVLVGLGSGSGVDFSLAAILWGLLAGLSYATYYLFGKRYFGRLHPATVFLYAMPLGALVLIPWVTWSPKGMIDWWVILYLALVPTYLAYLLYSIGIQRTEAGRAATVATLEPVIAAGLAWLLWREVLGGWGYLGAAFVVAGVLVTALERDRPEIVPHEGPVLEG